MSPGAAADSVRPLRSDGQRSREAILDAAHTALLRNQRTTMQEIAEAAGVGRSTIYRYFPTRTDLQEALSKRSRQLIGSSLARSDADPEGPLVDRDFTVALVGGAAGGDTAQFDRVQPAGQLGHEGRFPWMRPRCSTPCRRISSANNWLPKPNIAGVPVALYLVDVDGSQLVRLAGFREFPTHLEHVLALGGEIPSDGFDALERTLAERFPGSVSYPMLVRGRAIGVLVAVRRPGASLRELARQSAAAIGSPARTPTRSRAADVAANRRRRPSCSSDCFPRAS